MREPDFPPRFEPPPEQGLSEKTIRLLLGIGAGMRLALRIVAAVAIGTIAAFWTKVTISFNAPVLTKLMAEYRSYGYSETEGVISRSSVEKHSTGAAVPRIAYEYTVGNRRYSGTETSLQEQPRGHSALAITKRHPLGAKVAVYYDSAQPAHSLLQRGISGESLKRLLFQIPFNLIALGLWGGVIHLLWPGQEKAFPGGAPMRRGGAELWVRLPQSRPLTSAFVSLICTSFAAALLIGFTMPDAPSPAAMYLVLALILGRAILVFGRIQRKLTSGAEDLVIDRDHGSIRLPATFGRTKPVEMALSEVQRVAAAEILQTDGEGGRWYRYAAVLKIAGRPHGERLFLWKDRRCAAEFAEWLGDQIHKPRQTAAQVTAIGFHFSGSQAHRAR